MKKGLLFAMVLATSVLAGGVPESEAQGKPAMTRTKADGVMGQHTMDGTVTKVDAKNGWVDVKTSEGSMKLQMPSSVLENVKAGDSVTVDLALARTGSKETREPKKTSQTK